MNVKAMEWKCIFETYFCRVSDAPRRHHIWSKSCQCSLSPSPNCEQIKHKIKKFSVFCITWLLPSSDPDTGCSRRRRNSIEHITVIVKWRPKPPMLQYGNEGTKCYEVKAPRILYHFRWWGICVRFRLQGNSSQ